MRDVIFHLADGNMEKGLKAFFARDDWDFVLGCERFEIDPLSENDFFRVGGDTDGGIWKHAADNLRPFRAKYEHAVVILDADFAPNPGADVLRQDISAAMLRSGWPTERFLVVIIEPELEAWLWAPNLNVAQAFGFGDFERLRAALERENVWNRGEAKPHDLKAARNFAAKQGGKKTGGPIFKAVFSTISQAACERCEERGFICLRNALQEWFPRGKEAWQR
jgi:hypothetical protein